MERRFFLTIEDGKLVLDHSDRRTTGSKTHITSLSVLWNIVQDQNFLCSSSIDFPDEYTTDQNVITMCHIIRDGEDN